MSSTAGVVTCCKSCCWRKAVGCDPAAVASLSATRCLTCCRAGLACIHTASYAAIWSAVVMRWLLLLSVPPVGKPLCIISAKVRLCLASSCCRPVSGAKLPSLSRHSRGRTPMSGTHPGCDLHLNSTSLRVASLTVYCNSPRSGPNPHTLGPPGSKPHDAPAAAPVIAAAAALAARVARPVGRTPRNKERTLCPAAHQALC